MAVVIQLSEKEETKALPILLRGTPGTILPQRAYVISESAANELRAAGVSFAELGTVSHSTGVSGLAGVFRDDPTLREICDEIYRERDADRNRQEPT